MIGAMTRYHKNLWMLYGFVVLLSTSLLLFLLRGFYVSNQDQFKANQLIQVELFAASSDSLFRSQASLLQIVGHQLTQTVDLNQDNIHFEVRPILAQLLEIHPLIGGLALLSPSGDYLAVNSITEPAKFAKLPNLMEQEASRSTFMEALASDRLVLGHTYRHPVLDFLILPVRKTIRDKNDRPMAVMSAGLKLNSSSVFHNHLHTSNANRVMLIRSDFYPIFISADKVEDADYQQPAFQPLLESVVQSANQQLGLSLTELKQEDTGVHVKVDFNGTEDLVTVKYLAEFDVWAMSDTPTEFINSYFYQDAIWAFGVFFIVLLIFFLLIRSTVNNDKVVKEKLVFQASHDELTGLPNRYHLRTSIQKWLTRPTRPFALFYIDIDNFKSVNDSHGHDFGDHVLQQIAIRLTMFASKDRLLVRQSSDEFILLLRETKHQALAAIAQEIIDVISQPFTVEQAQFSIGCSIGIASYPHHGSSLDSLLRCADISMFAAKAERNSFNIYSDVMESDHLFKLQVEQHLRQAIDDQRPYLVYQPQVRPNGEVYGVEALVRWYDEKLGFIPPDVFIPIAEQSGQMVKLGRYIIERAIAEVTQLQAELDIRFQLSINVSVKQFMQGAFIDHLTEVAKKNQFNLRLLTVEITENLFIEDIEKFKPVCQRLHQLGVCLSLDDFGTGYSSLSMLRAFPIDELKIDRSFIEHIVEDEQSLHIVRNIIAIGRNFNMEVVAEGVETDQQREKLVQFGCDVLQGYFYSRPISLSDLSDYMKQHWQLELLQSS
ncbi:bifunctional diguanylate cyclase/phosphodiesterase [Vibrio sp.]|uniref:bifunctional diguanylate cyclase/phosphodiesterase n=1 Tax=Vibrio sp. TaxID=678 RepID=UPI003D0D2C76